MRMKVRFRVSAAVLLCAFLSGCKTSEDAVATSQQLTTTAADLKAYYAALANAETEAIALSELDSSISGTPLSDSARKDLEATRAAIWKREEMADNLANLAGSFAALSGSKVPGDVATAATALGNELIQVNVLPAGSSVPDILGRAGNALLLTIRQHDERKAAQAMDQTVAAVTSLFFHEKPVYDSITRYRLREARQVATDLINGQQVDPTPLLAPALKPFDLAPMPPSPSLQGNLRSLGLKRLADQSNEALRKANDASKAMNSALGEMSSRVHQLATTHHMPARGNPFSLKTVEQWLEQLS